MKADGPAEYLCNIPYCFCYLKCYYIYNELRNSFEIKTENSRGIIQMKKASSLRIEYYHYYYDSFLCCRR